MENNKLVVNPAQEYVNSLFTESLIGNNNKLVLVDGKYKDIEIKQLCLKSSDEKIHPVSIAENLVLVGLVDEPVEFSDIIWNSESATPIKLKEAVEQGRLPKDSKKGVLAIVATAERIKGTSQFDINNKVFEEQKKIEKLLK